MDVQDQTTHTTPSGHESHGVHLCHRCGWPFPNPHPSARHRRAHKKICGTIEGYTNLIGSEVVSDDEDHPEDYDDKEKTPSPKIGENAIRGSFSRSEDEMFTDAVTEFADNATSAGSKNKNLDRDVFFSFKDAGNDGTNEVLNAPVEISKVNTGVEVSEKTDPHVEKVEETAIKTVGDLSESNLELTKTVAGPTPEPSLVSQLQEAESIDVMEAGEEKGQESQISETIIEEANDLNKVKQENIEKLESLTADGIIEEIKQEITSDFEHVSEAVKESETVEEIKTEKSDLDFEIAPETDHLGGVTEEIKHEKFESDHEHVPEVAKESEIDQEVIVLNEKVDLGAPIEQIQEVVKEPVAVLTEKKDLEETELAKSSIEQVQEAVKEPVAVLIEKEDLGGPQLEIQSIEHTNEVVEKPVFILNEKDLGTPELEGCSKEQFQEVVKEPATVLTEKEDLDGPHMEKQSKEHTHEVIEKPDSIFPEKQDLGAPELKKFTEENVVEEPDSVFTEKEDLGEHKSEKSSKDEVIEQEVNNDHNLVADISTETITLKDSSDNSITNCKNTSEVVPEPVVEEGNGKLMNNQDSGADVTVDSSSHNSLEGTWGSVSVLSAASVDAESLQSAEKSKVNSVKSNAATSDAFDPPSFMTLVEPESKDKNSGSSEVKDSEPQLNSENSKAGWFPTLTNVNNESEGRKRNEEAMAKVTNWSTGKQSTPLKNLLGDAKSPSGKQPEPVVPKDEGTVNPPVNDEVSSPPKLIEDEKKERKKVKGRSSWVPFMCCSSVNAVK
ncbi:hypothetical protein SSX86_008921 [Deinandra increscens subsp. villosa]|uniref:C2H2-type domain-containing protein n=1 Tax=Deinandra increscens subsp. villosa TaxID=3103831 RepID=A0AAP0DGU2_9ASTR